MPRPFCLSRSTKKVGLRLALVWGTVTGAALAQDTPARLVWNTLVLRQGHARAADTTGAEHELSLDAELQDASRLLLQRARAVAGAASLIDVATGQVLAAAEVGHTPEGSLLFEPIAPAASVFKLVTTIALYEHTRLTPTERVCTRGGIRTLTDEHLEAPRGDGVVCNPFGQALGVSRNAAYARVAHDLLAPGLLRTTAERLGFNRERSAEVPGQVGALTVPEGELAYARTAAGFENSRLSVLGGAELALTVATGGLRRPLTFLPEHPDSLPRAPEPAERLFSTRSARRVTQAMEFTVHSGTAREAFRDETGRPHLGRIRVAGKTGTRQPRSGAPTASWFVGFAPSDRPRIVVSVLLQNSDLWHQKANQVARDLLRVYFSRLGAPGVTSPLTQSAREAVRTASRTGSEH